MNVAARINIATPTGIRLVRELAKHSRTVSFDNPFIDEVNGVKGHNTVKEAFKELETKLNQHYGTNYQLKL